MTPWNVFLYVASDTHLQDDARNAVAQLMGLTLRGQVNTFALLDVQGAATELYLPGGEELGLGDRNTGDPATLSEFLRLGERYPAERTCLVIWNHGHGVLHSEPQQKRRYLPLGPWGQSKLIRESLPPPDSQLSKSSAEDTGTRPVLAAEPDDYLTHHEVTEAIRAAGFRGERKLDVLAFHACLTSLVELAYELEDIAHHFVASETLVASDQWPYDRMLSILHAARLVDGKALATHMVQEFARAPFKGSITATLAAFDLSQVEAFGRALDQLGTELVRVLPQVHAAHARMIRLHNPDYVDLGSMFDELCLACEDEPEVLLALAVARARFQSMRMLWGRSGPQHAEKSGMAVFLPMAGGNVFLPSYRELSLCTPASDGWCAFVHQLLNEPLPGSLQSAA